MEAIQPSPQPARFQYTVQIMEIDPSQAGQYEIDMPPMTRVIGTWPLQQSVIGGKVKLIMLVERLIPGNAQMGVGAEPKPETH